jgi:tetratricopeptide (TPR) repeat protein
MNKLTHCFIALAVVAASGGVSAANNYCGELKNHYGPLDFRMRGQVNLEIVEGAHFTEEVAKGNPRGSTGDLAADLDYTLRAIPNHPGALTTIGAVSIRAKTARLATARYPTECYFERAIRFAPDDAAVRAVYGNYLNALGRLPQALNMFRFAVELAPNNATYNYNLGLAYVKMKQYDKAEEYANKAYELGFPLQGLRKQLDAAHKTASAAR